VRFGGATKNLGRYTSEEEAFAVVQEFRRKYLPFAVE